jgi:hypothetical protein
MEVMDLESEGVKKTSSQDISKFVMTFAIQSVGERYISCWKDMVTECNTQFFALG